MVEFEQMEGTEKETNVVNSRSKDKEKELFYQEVAMSP